MRINESFFKIHISSKNTVEIIRKHFPKKNNKARFGIQKGCLIRKNLIKQEDIFLNFEEAQNIAELAIYNYCENYNKNNKLPLQKSKFISFQVLLCKIFSFPKKCFHYIMKRY